MMALDKQPSTRYFPAMSKHINLFIMFWFLTCAVVFGGAFYTLGYERATNAMQERVDELTLQLQIFNEHHAKPKKLKRTKTVEL